MRCFPFEGDRWFREVKLHDYYYYYHYYTRRLSMWEFDVVAVDQMVLRA